MNNLHVYACSFGLCGYVSKKFSYYVEPNKSFGDVIARELQYDLVNNSRPGACNYMLFKQVVEDKHKFKLGDRIIVQWTHIDRGYSINDYTVMPNHVDHHNAEIAETAKIYYKYLYDEHQSFSELVGYTYYLNNILSGFYYSLVDDHAFIKKVDTEMFSKFTNIGNYVSIDGGIHSFMSSFKSENVCYPCQHPSELGHVKLAELYIKALKNE
jgi:hypothetical protein